MTAIKRLFFDIETSPNIGWFWRPGHKVRLSPDNIIKERAVICSCWKWAGDKKVQSVTWNPRTQDDERAVRQTAELLNEADEIVGHNGDKFDVNWIRGRCIQLGIPLNPKLKVQDTYKLGRRYFNMNNQRLDYWGQYLGLGHKMATGGSSLWLSVMDGDKKALKKMVDYCKRDVDLLEKVWDRMMAYVPARTHVSCDPSQCPECGSNETIVSKRRTTAAGHKQVQFRCKDCGKYHTIAASRYDRAKALKA